MAVQIVVSLWNHRKWQNRLHPSISFALILLHNLNLCTSSDLSAPEPSLNFSRSVYTKCPIAKGDLLTLDNIGTYRPSHSESGISLLTLLGGISANDIQSGHPILVSDIILQQ